jgi:hypothetical protein
VRNAWIDGSLLTIASRAREMTSLHFVSPAAMERAAWAMVVVKKGMFCTNMVAWFDRLTMRVNPVNPRILSVSKDTRGTFNSYLCTFLFIPPEQINADDNSDNSHKADAQLKSYLEFDGFQIDQQRFIIDKVTDSDRKTIGKKCFDDIAPPGSIPMRLLRYDPMIMPMMMKKTSADSGFSLRRPAIGVSFPRQSCRY